LELSVTDSCQILISQRFQVSTFAVLENLTQIAVGLANGTVVLIRGDLQKERTTKQKVIHEGSEPITGTGYLC
jgi:hypothetical protein